ncbi:MAG TPA: GAF domain-containing protein, partial [Casimicrobiaceae bacterium]|nr:GAF domain-containing protein [Casimicrobiaceae bacterium]
MRRTGSHRNSKRGKHPSASAASVQRVRELAWAGQHAAAIDVASSALDASDLAVGDRIDLLDLRCESYVAFGDLERAQADAAALSELAIRSLSPALVAQAGNRAAILQIRQGEAKTAVATAEDALASARKARDRVLEATSQLRLGEARFRLRDNVQAIAAAREALRLFREMRRPAGENRALWVLAAAASNLGRTAEAARLSREALDIARRCGDWFGVGNAANMLGFDEADRGKRFRLYKESLAAFTRAGYVERQAIITHNLGTAYHHLGLYRRARRYLLAAREATRRTGARGQMARSAWMLAVSEASMGHAADVEHYAQAAILEADDVGGEGYISLRSAVLGLIAFHQGDMRTAAQHRREAAEIARTTGQDGVEIHTLTELAEALIAGGDAVAALDASTRATELHAKHDFAQLQGTDPPMLWWQHNRALAANGQSGAARIALDRAYRLVVDGIATLGDEGLRRNYLNKVAHVRAIVTAWLDASRTKRLPPHLGGEANLREPFERLVDTGLRLNEIRSSEELREFLIDEATELSGAERVLLILAMPDGGKLAGAQMPKGEDAALLMDDVSPMFDSVARTRAAVLEHVPEDARRLAQRSRIVAPLVAQHELIGFLYADIDGAFGRFHEADRDLLAMLASQAAVALANARASEGLEAKVAARTEELRTSNAQLEARAAELAIINSVQQALAGELSMQGVYDAVGDKIREVFHGAIVWIRIYDPVTGLEHFPYANEKGRRHHVAPLPVTTTGFGGHVYRTGKTLLVDENVTARAAEFASTLLTKDATIPQTQLMVPLLAGGGVRGILVLNDVERERAFSESDVRLLETLAASMSVALENARLFDETQRLLKETEQRNAELAIINSVQRALAGELSLQGVYDAVGDKLRAVFHGAVVAIRLYDPATGIEHFPYLHGTEGRGSVEPRPLSGFGVEVIRTGKTLIIDEDFAARAAAIGTKSMVEPSDLPKTQLMVPLMVGAQARGILQLNDMNREHAFGPSDIRLLETLASSMSVALENARLFDETQRLLKETEQRAAELAVINSIQQGIASKLEFQAIVDLVGDKLRQVFATENIGVRWVDYATKTVHFLYEYEHGVRIHPAPSSFDPEKPVTKRLVARETVLLNTRAEMEALKIRAIPGTDSSHSCVFVPIVGSDRVLGAIVMEDYEREHAFGASQVRLLETVAASMGVAMENARLFDESQRRTRETAALAEVGRELSSSLDLDTVLDRIAHHAKDLLGAENSAIFLPDADGTSYQAIVAIGEAAREISATAIEVGRGIIGSLVAEKRAAFVNDTRSDARGIQIPGTVPKNEERLMVAPLMSGETVKGVMALWRNGGRPFDDAELAFLVGLARQATVAVQNARLFNETQDALAHQTATSDILRVISESPTDVQPVFEAIVQAGVRLFEGAAVAVSRPEGGQVKAMAIAEEDASRAARWRAVFPFPLSHDYIHGAAMLDCRIIDIPDVLEMDGRFEAGKRNVAPAGYRAMTVVPMVKDGTAIGAVAVVRPRPGALSPKELVVVKTFAEQAVIAIENVRLFNETKEALDQQTAISEILRVISALRTEVKPVLDAIVERAARLCDASAA